MADEPRLDPTARTIEQQQWAVNALERLLTARLDALEKAQEKFQDDVTRVPTEVQKAVQNLRELHDEKFAAIEQRFVERDRRFSQLQESNQAAIDAALSSSEKAHVQQNEANNKAIDKAEATTAAALRQLQDSLAKAVQTLDEKIGDIKNRLTILESLKLGQRDERQDQRGSVQQWLGVAGAIMLAIGLLVTFMNTPRLHEPSVVIERRE